MAQLENVTFYLTKTAWVRTPQWRCGILPPC